MREESCYQNFEYFDGEIYNIYVIRHAHSLEYAEKSQNEAHC